MAASSITVACFTVTATSALAQYQPVQATGAPATAAGNSLGFATTSANSGSLVGVAAIGTAVAVAGAAIAIGAALEVHSNVAQVVTRSAGVTIGRALTAASSAGDQIEVLLITN
jgi:hypothetical protein